MIIDTDRSRWRDRGDEDCSVPVAVRSTECPSSFITQQNRLSVLISGHRYQVLSKRTNLLSLLSTCLLICSICLLRSKCRLLKFYSKFIVHDRISIAVPLHFALMFSKASLTFLQMRRSRPLLNNHWADRSADCCLRLLIVTTDVFTFVYAKSISIETFRTAAWSLSVAIAVSGTFPRAVECRPPIVDYSATAARCGFNPRGLVVSPRQPARSRLTITAAGRPGGWLGPGQRGAEW